MKKYLKHFLLFIILIHKLCTYAQQTDIDSLKNLSYSILTEKFIEFHSDSLLSSRYATAYFLKAKADRDSLKMADGYYFRKIIDKNNHRTDLYDSIINISKDSKNNRFPAIAYFDKGNYLFGAHKYILALENYIEASRYNDGNNERVSFLIDCNIGVLQLRIGNYMEALETLKEAQKISLRRNYLQNEPNRHFVISFYLADAYRKNNYLDSARVLIKSGLKESKEQKSTKDFYDFLLLDGMLTLDDDTNLAIRKLDSALVYLSANNFETNSSFAYQYLGKAYLKKNQEDIALDYFLKVDSLLNDKEIIFYELLDSYEYIKDYYHKEGDIKNELKYINKILTYESKFDNRYREISNKIISDYEIPVLIRDKEKIISQLNKKSILKNYVSYFLIFTIIAIIFIVRYYQIKTKKKYTKRFNELVAQANSSRKEKTTAKKETLDSLKLDIPEDIINRVLKAIKKFEAHEHFLERTMNVASLSKKIGTNSSYFSKIFKFYKKQHFSSYIKDLRLEYAFQRLENDAVFRKYSIKAIAQESGFNNSESFSKGFRSKYGIHPSFFIECLEKSK